MKVEADKALVERLKDLLRPALNDAFSQDVEGTHLRWIGVHAALRLKQAYRELEALSTEIEALRKGVEMALHCTPHVRDGKIIYDCGDPWEILSALLKGTPDNGQG